MKAKQTKSKQKEQDIEKIIADNFKVIRKIKGLTLVEVGKVLGCTGQQVQKYEVGKNRISIAILAKFANLTNFPIPFFFKEIDWKDLTVLKEE